MGQNAGARRIGLGGGAGLFFVFLGAPGCSAPIGSRAPEGGGLKLRISPLAEAPDGGPSP